MAHRSIVKDFRDYAAVTLLGFVSVGAVAGAIGGETAHKVVEAVNNGTNPAVVYAAAAFIVGGPLVVRALKHIKNCRPNLNS